MFKRSLCGFLKIACVLACCWLLNNFFNRQDFRPIGKINKKISKIFRTNSQLICAQNYKNFNFSSKIYENGSKFSDCDEILNGRMDAVCKWSNFTETQPTDEQMFFKFENGCQKWKIEQKYSKKPNSFVEASFPLAFSISMHKNVAQVERLIRSIFWPQNLYCLHIDEKASNWTHAAMLRFSRCFPNIFVTKSEKVYWAGFGVLRSVLNCMNDTLLQYPRHKWRYFINLSGQDFPLKTNLELVQILEKLNGTNDVELQYEMQFDRYWYFHKHVFDRTGRLIAHRPIHSKSKLPVPENWQIYKGNLAACLNRKFVEFLLTNELSLAFTDWLNGTDTSDEHFWATLNHNIIKNIGLAPGGYDAYCHNFSKSVEKPWIARFVHWRGAKTFCHGKLVRDVCVFGLGDLHRITSRRRPELFANKFYADFQSKALICLEKWFFDKIEKNSTLNARRLQFYENFQHVRHKKLADNKLCGKDMGNLKNNVPPLYKKLVKGVIN